MPKVVSVHSYRGGTGKSNFTANLATVALQGRRVGVVDTDIQSPGIHNIFGLDPEMMNKTLNHYLWRQAPISDAAYDVSELVKLSGEGKIFLVPSSVKADDISRILSEGYDVKLLNDGFRKLVKDLQLDYLFIDTHPGLSKETFSFYCDFSCFNFNSTADKQDYQGTAVTVDVARQLRVKKMLLVVNKVLKSMNFEDLQHKIESVYDTPLAGIFPLTEEIVQLGSSGVFCLQSPEHSISQEFHKVAQQLMS